MLDRLLSKNKNRRFVIIGLLLWVLYAVLTFFTPASNNIYHLSPFSLLMAKLSVVLPVLFIWIVAINGASTLRTYALAIREGKDGRALRLIAAGLLLVILSFILQSLLGTLPRYFVGSHIIYPLVTLANHVPVLISLAAFIVILRGALQLRAISVRRLSVAGLASILFPYLVLGGLYGMKFYQSLPLGSTNRIPLFAVPGKMPFFTIGLPYIAIWMLGILSITIIAEYARTVNGVIYRKALKDLVRGLTGVLAFSIMVQLLQLSAGVFAHMSLFKILMIVYVLLILYAIGFVFIARGADKLMIIEQTT